MTEEKHSNIAENTENHTVCIKEEPFRPPTDRLARIAVIAAAVELIFGLLMLLKCIFEFEPNKYSSEAVGWHNITVTVQMLAFCRSPDCPWCDCTDFCAHCIFPISKKLDTRRRM